MIVVEAEVHVGQSCRERHFGSGSTTHPFGNSSDESKMALTTGMN